MENFQLNQVPKSAAQRKKEKRKLKKKLKKLQKEENMDRLSTTASTTSTNTTTTTSTVNVNEIINQKGKDLKLIRKKLNKEAKEQAEKELEKQLQKIVNSSKKNFQSQNLNQKNPIKSDKKNKNKKKNQPNSNKQSKKEFKSESIVETCKAEKTETKDENSKSFGDLDDFSEQETINKLNDLDDFEPVKVKSKAKLNSLDDFGTDISKSDKIDLLDDLDETSKNSTNFRKLIIPDDIFIRVVGSKNSNLILIEKITNAKLNLDKCTVEISADSMESVEFALELLHTLINDPQASLAYLLPVECTEKVECKPVKNESKTKSVVKISKTNSVTKNDPIVSKISQNVQTQKPRNFAEAVAKKPINNQIKNSSFQISINEEKKLPAPQPILASNNTFRPVSVVSPFKNDKIVEKLEDLKIEVTKKADVSSMYTSQSSSSFSSSTSSSSPSSSNKSEQKPESVYNAISQLWSFNENGLLNRLSPFLSSSSTNIDKINTTNIPNNLTMSKPIGYERNGKLQQINNNAENQSSLLNPFNNQNKMNDSIIKSIPMAYPTSTTQTNQWLNYHAYYQQEAGNPLISSNYIYQNYGFNNFTNNFGLNGGYGIQMAHQTQPNMVLQSTTGNLLTQQQYRY